MAEAAGQLNEHLQSLEDLLNTDVLSKKSLDDLLAGYSHYEQAKLNVFLSYVIHDLSWIYLKTRGVDPNAHAVKGELERVKDYFAKLRAREEKPQARQFRPDQDAAARFIRHAIATGGEHAKEPVAGPSRIPQVQRREPSPPVGTHTRFEFLSKEQPAPSSDQANEDSSDDEMQIINGDDGHRTDSAVSVSSSSSSEMAPPGKAEATPKKPKSFMQRASEKASGKVTSEAESESTITEDPSSTPMTTAQLAHALLERKAGGSTKPGKTAKSKARDRAGKKEWLKTAPAERAMDPHGTAVQTRQKRSKKKSKASAVINGVRRVYNDLPKNDRWAAKQAEKEERKKQRNEAAAAQRAAQALAAIT